MQRYFMQLYFVSLYLSDREKTGTKFSNSGCTPPETKLAQILATPKGTSCDTQLHAIAGFSLSRAPSGAKSCLHAPQWVIRAAFTRSTRKRLAIVISSKGRNVKQK